MEARRNIQAEFDQLSAAEVPGFDVRTTCDDVIAKLWALRQRITIPVPDGLAAMLDDIDEQVEAAIAVGHDPDATPIGNEYATTIADYTLRRYCGGRLATSASPQHECSCGGLWMDDDLPVAPQSHA